MDATTYGLDVAKRVFQMYWVEAETGEILNRRFVRDELIRSLAQRPAGQTSDVTTAVAASLDVHQASKVTCPLAGQEHTMQSLYFHRLEDAVRGLAIDPATATDPIRRTFLCDGQELSCNVNILEGGADVIHIQPDHDEIVLVLEGECGFRVGDETRPVKPGDLMFIPRDTVHGPIIDRGRVALLSIFAPFFDRTKKNIRWSRDAFE